jgi:hypothetical protein
MVEELASARRALLDVNTRMAAATTGLEQLQKEPDELRSGLQMATQECDVAVQERDAAVAVAIAGEASELEKTALASLQGTFLVLLFL